MWLFQILGYGACHIFRQLYWHSISNHLLLFCLRPNKLK